MSDVMTYATGFLAQGFFSARTLVQWLMSERAGRVLSPSVFWIFSLTGSILLFVYGWERNDFSIILGQFVSYYIYIWNLNVKGVWGRLPLMPRGMIMALPLAAVFMAAAEGSSFAGSFLTDSGIPVPLMLFGSAGQLVFTARFVYQWAYSRRRHRSELPAGFWAISLTGSLCIAVYGMLRSDPVLIIGQSVGLVAYIRNLILHKKRKNTA